MTTLALVDITASQALDCKAMAALRGGAQDHLAYKYTSYSAWSSMSRFYQQRIGYTWHDGYLTNHYYEGWQKQRTEYETSYWNRYYRV